jgi:oxalate decarboxylase/phosphoglucose isomerase-like protein (cupin superfamily)
MMRFLQRPGDIVYIPTGWLHAVLNRSLSVAVTHNFIFPECARTSSQAQAARGR